MVTLKDAGVWRGGVTSPYTSLETMSIDAKAVSAGRRGRGPQVRLHHTMSSKGGGTTSVDVDIGVASFVELIFEMLKADRDATINAFAKAIIKTSK